MTRDEIIDMALEAGFSEWAVRTPQDLERFAALVAAAERNKIAAWMMANGYATGHGDTTEDLLGELGWQIAEKLKMEGESCADICDQHASVEGIAQRCAADIRARGNA
jgi:hypothetical protein